MEQRPLIDRMSVQDVDQLSLEQLLSSTQKVVVVEFYLPDCPICQELAPVLEALSKELDDEAVFTKVNAEDNLELAIQYGVLVTPTIKMFCGQSFRGEIVGDTNATILRNTVRDVIRHRSCSSAAGKISYEPDGYG